MAKITNEEIFGKGLFKPTIDQVKVLLASIKDLKKELVDLAKANKKTAQDNAGKQRTKNIEELTKAQKVAIKLAKEKQKLEEEELKFTKILEKEQEDLLKRRIELNKARKDTKKQMEAEVILREQLGKTIKSNADVLKNLDAIEKRNLTTRKDAVESNKALRTIIDGLDTSIEEEADAIQRLNAVIDKNTDFIKENSDTNVQNKINVGNYKESVKEALAETDAFNGILGEFGETGGKIVGIIKQQAIAFKEQAEAIKNSEKNVGGLRKGFRNLNNVLKGSIIGAIATALLAMGNALSQSRKGMIEFRVIASQLNNTIRLLGERLFGVVVAIGDVYVKAFDVAKRKALELELAWLKLKNANPFGDDQSNAIKKVNDELAKTDDVGILDIYKELFAVVGKTSDAFKGFMDQLKKTNPVVAEQVRLEQQLIDLRALSEVRLSKINAQIEIQQQKADDSTRSFKDQQKALDEVARLQKERTDEQISLAEKEFKNAKRLAELDIEARISSGKASAEELAFIKSIGEEDLKNLEFLKSKNGQLLIEENNLELLKGAVVSLNELEGQRFLEDEERSRRRREILRDEFEQNLDFAIDFFDAQKTINERLIADEEQTFRKRFDLLQETNKLREEAFEDQIALTEEFIEKSLRSQGKTEQQITEALTKVNIRKLATLKDEREVRKVLVEEGFTDEKVNTRILEILKEQKIAKQDILEIQKELNKALDEQSEQGVENLLNLQEERKEREIRLLEEAFDEKKELFKEEEEFNQQRFNDAVDSLEEQIEAELKLLDQQETRTLSKIEEGSTEYVRLKEQFAEERRLIEKKSLESEQQLIDEANKKKLDAQKKADAKLLEQQRENARDISQILEQLTDAQRKQFEERQSAIDGEIDANQKRQDDLRDLARQGQQDAKDNLATLEREQKELRLRKQQEEQAQARRELGFTALKTYSANAEKNPDTALQDTISDIGLLLAFIQSLQGFYEGTERVGDSMNPALNTGKDDYIVRVDKDEKILNPEHSKRIGYDMSNEDVVRIVERFKRGELTEGLNVNPIINHSWQSNQEIISKFDELKTAIESKPVYEFQYDQVERAVTTIMKDRNKVIRNHKKQGGIW